MSPIDLEWLKKYVDTLLELTEKLDPDTAMGQATLRRAEAVMDMAQAWKEFNKEK